MSDFKKSSSITKLKNACAGLLQAFKQEKTLRVNLMAMLTVTFFGFYFKVTNTEWLILILTFALVICLEMVNTIAEELCDLYTLDHNLHIKKIKDIAAGATLLAAVSAVFVGGLIFIKHL